MKLIYQHPSIHELRAAKKRFLRAKRARRTTIKKSNKNHIIRSHRIIVPAILDLYAKRNHHYTCLFLDKLRKSAKSGTTLNLCFRNTIKITAAAALLMLAVVDSLLKKNPTLKINCSLPPMQSKGKFKNADFLVESALNRIGFFRLIGKTERKTPGYANVDCWAPLVGDIADGTLAGKLLKQVESSGAITRQATSRLYRGAFEAIANCVDHAYPEQPTQKTKYKEKRWWMFVGSHESHLSIIICDLGVGIPKTLPHTHPESLIERIFTMLGISTKTDGELIRAATYIKRTRTEQEHRGKGGSDLRSLIDHYPEGYLSIYSNKGSFSTFGQKCSIRGRKNRKILSKLHGMQIEAAQDYKYSVRGTIIEWALPLEALEK